MKVAVIRRQFSATGGAELYVQRLLKALAESGHEPHLFAEAWDGAPAGVTLHPVEAPGSRAVRPWRFALRTRDMLAAERFDCVFSLERTIRQDVYRAGDGVHRVWLERRRQFAPWWRRPFTGVGAFHRNMRELEAQTFNVENTRRIIVNSTMVKSEILQHFGFPIDRLHVVRNGIEVERFQRGDREATRQKFGIGEDEFVVLFVGSGWERKGLQYLINAVTSIAALQLETPVTRWSRRLLERMDALPNLPKGRVRLLVVGKGKRPSRPPESVIFAGPMKDVENAYAAADLFVSLPIYEPCSNAVSEALAAGLPVITSAQNGASEIIEEDVNGSVLPLPNDTTATVDAICHWWSRRYHMDLPDPQPLSLERNVLETIAVLEQAARER